MSAALLPCSVEAVSALMREVGEEILLPRFGALQDGDIDRKQGGEIVTICDRHAEAALEAGLGKLCPEALFVGEEGTAADRSRLDALAGEGPIWIIDPLDGTQNFTEGKPEFCIIIAYRRAGATLAGWIHEPLAGTTLSAVVGEGAWDEGRPARVAETRAPTAMRGYLSGRLHDGQTRRQAFERAQGFAEIRGLSCAGLGYTALARGEVDFLAGRVTKPWDHAAGALIVTEAGGHVARVDGTGYVPDALGPALLAASSQGTWQTVRDHMMAPEPAGSRP